MRIAIAKEEFNRKISLYASKLNIELKKYWFGVIFGALLYMAQRPDDKKIGVELFGEL